METFRRVDDDTDDDNELVLLEEARRVVLGVDVLVPDEGVALDIVILPLDELPMDQEDSLVTEEAKEDTLVLDALESDVLELGGRFSLSELVSESVERLWIPEETRRKVEPGLLDVSVDEVTPLELSLNETGLLVAEMVVEGLLLLVGRVAVVCENVVLVDGGGGEELLLNDARVGRVVDALLLADTVAVAKGLVVLEATEELPFDIAGEVVDWLPAVEECIVVG